MKLDKTQVCVYIENEAQLQEARELLEKYGEEINQEWFNLTVDFHNLKLGGFNIWYIGFGDSLTQITLSELEQILAL